MSKIGKIGFPDIDYVRKPYSEETEKKIDREIERIYKECQVKAEALIVEKKELIEKLKVLILEKETLTHNSLKEVLGDRPFSNHENYEKFLNDSKKS
jgi:AFG3 family protein